MTLHAHTVWGCNCGPHLDRDLGALADGLLGLCCKARLSVPRIVPRCGLLLRLAALRRDVVPDPDPVRVARAACAPCCP